MPEQIIVIGAGGHGKVIADIIEQCGDMVVGFLDDGNLSDNVLGYPILGKISDCIKYTDKKFIIAIGNNEIRKHIAEKYVNLDYYTAIHPHSVISNHTSIGSGSVIMANAVINSSTLIGKHCIINTGAVLEHDNIIKNYAHISPNATLGGTVSIGEGTHIGIGATVKNNISICSNCRIGAGAVVVKNLFEQATYVGVPALKMGGGPLTILHNIELQTPTHFWRWAA